VPERVLALPSTVPVGKPPAAIVFRRDEDGRLEAGPRNLPPHVRRALDRGEPVVRRVVHTPPTPGRTLLLALIAASTLTGAVSSSVAGERTARTLATLLAAGVTRTEIVLGKWLAWGGAGAVSTMLAASVALALDRVEVGWWLLPLPLVPLGTVAIGLALVRRATDVIAGTAVSLRVLPALLVAAGLLAWMAGRTSPLLGAAVPLGGALVAAGDTWEGPLPALLAAVSTGLTIGVCLHVTARDLDETIGQPAPPGPLALTLRTGLLAAGMWWTPVVTAAMWAAAGNPKIIASLSAEEGMVAGGLGLVLMTVMVTAREGADARPWLRLPSLLDMGLAIVIGSALATTSLVAGLPIQSGGLLADMSALLEHALQPSLLTPAALIVVVLGQELIFRGWLAARVGPVASTLCWIAVVAPLDPIRGLISGAALAYLTHRAEGSAVPAIVARFAWAAAALAISP